MESEYKVCFICGIIVTQKNAVQNFTLKGYNSLIEASKKKGDNKWTTWRRLEDVVFHKQCRSSYLLKVRYSEKRKRKDNQLRNATTFNYSELCIFCDQPCPILLQQSMRVAKRERIIYLSETSKKYVLDLTYKINNPIASKVRRRLIDVSDLNNEPVKYHYHCFDKCIKSFESIESMHRLVDVEMHEKLNEIFDFLENSDLDVFTIEELLKKMGNCAPSIQFFQHKLIEKFGDEIVISKVGNKKTLVTFCATANDILTDDWYTQRKKSLKSEEFRIVETAAKIILKDYLKHLTANKINDDVYPPSDNFLQNSREVVPHSLQRFLDTVILNRKQANLEDHKKKSTNIAHAIMSATRPRTFISPILLGFSIYLNRKFGSKRLIEVTSHLGFCASYEHAVQYEASAATNPPPSTSMSTGTFSQYVFDNVDFDITTMDGHNTFHSMGGIECITPSKNIPRIPPLSRITEKISADYIAAKAVIPIIHSDFTAEANKELKKIIIQNVYSLKPLTSNVWKESEFSLCWLMGKSLKIPQFPDWHGYVESCNTQVQHQKSTIRYLPFVNLKATSTEALASVIKFAAEETVKKGQNKCFITFDQQRYIKARDIVESYKDQNLFKNVVIRLSGFHLLMSHLGAIGHIMDGSGLKEAWCEIYAEKSTEKMLNGKSYIKAIRAHMITQAALVKPLIDELNLTEAQKNSFKEDLGSYKSSGELKKSVLLIKAIQQLCDYLEIVSKRGKTAKLWLQYIEMVCLLENFLRAERTGDFDLHVSTIMRMLPYFTASGHINYAKSGHLYVQDMLNLKDNLIPSEYELYVEKGYFTISRTDKPCSAISPDMVIEQTLNRAIKATGGLTRRGVTESTAANWLLLTPACVEVCESLEKYANVFSESSDQHTALRESSIQQDELDASKLSTWFANHPPFPNTSELLSLATGVVGDDEINCWDAWTIGLSNHLNMIGNNFVDLIALSKLKVRSLSTVGSNVTVNNTVIPIHTNLLFQRIIRAPHTDEELQSYFAFEMSSIPLSLFDEKGMRNTDLSKSLTMFKSCTSAPTENRINIIDGEYLLNSMNWPNSSTYDEIYNKYVNLVKTSYGINTIVVFHLNNENSIPMLNSVSRREVVSEGDIIFFPNMSVGKSRDQFFSNEKNKRRFIEQLIVVLRHSNITTAAEGNETLIAQIAVKKRIEHENIVIIGSNPEIFIFLIAFAHPKQNIYFLKESNSSTWYSSQFSQQEFPKLKNNILFLHAATGCQTTSALFDIDKAQAFKVIDKHKIAENWIRYFYEEKARHSDLSFAGEQFLLNLYNAPKQITSLNHYRYIAFCKASVNQTKEVNLASLPPTAGAALQHLLRVYYTVQKWINHKLTMELWGWTYYSNCYFPITTLDSPAPSQLLTLIFCNCQQNCGRTCGCRKAGLLCTNICGTCLGMSCDNSTPIKDINVMDEESMDVGTEESEDIDEPQPGTSGTS